MLSQRKGKQLPKGKRDEFVAETGKSIAELTYRMQLAETYATEDEVFTAGEHFSSWREFRKSLSAKPEPNPEAEGADDHGVGKSRHETMGTPRMLFLPPIWRS